MPCPNPFPMLLARGLSNVAARDTDAGKQALANPPLNATPLAPLGPSEVFNDGTPSLSTGLVVQKSRPARSEIFSSVVSWEMMELMSGTEIDNSDCQMI